MLCYISFNIPGSQTNLLYMDVSSTGYTWIKKITWKTLLLPFLALYTYLYTSKLTHIAAKPEEINIAHCISSQTTNICFKITPLKSTINPNALAFFWLLVLMRYPLVKMSSWACWLELQIVSMITTTNVLEILTKLYCFSKLNIKIYYCFFSFLSTYFLLPIDKNLLFVFAVNIGEPSNMKAKYH